MPIDRVVLGACEEVLRTLPDAWAESIVCDPPYGLGTKEPTARDIDLYLRGEPLDTGGDFMGKRWQIPPIPTWRECYRVLKPGGHLLAFASTRTWDLMSMGLRGAGFDDRNTIASRFRSPALMWIHGQGFPKSTNIAKKILDRSTEERLPSEEVERLRRLAVAFEGWGTSLKPAWEPVLCFRKPLTEDASSFPDVGCSGPSLVMVNGAEHAPERDLAHVDAPFFYASKASRSEKSLGGSVEVTHVTVKPLRLMRWLVTAVTPARGLVLDPFAGSGTTALAALAEGRHYLLIERDPTYHAEATARIEAATWTPWLARLLRSESRRGLRGAAPLPPKR